MPNFMPIETKLSLLEGYKGTERQTDKQTNKQASVPFQLHRFVTLLFTHYIIFQFIVCLSFFSSSSSLSLLRPGMLHRPWML